MPDHADDDDKDDAEERLSRRAFLIGLGKGSPAVIAGVLLGSALSREAEADGFGWINRRGGRIRAENNPDGGATFAFLLPVVG